MEKRIGLRQFWDFLTVSNEKEVWGNILISKDIMKTQQVNLEWYVDTVGSGFKFKSLLKC